MKTKTMASLLRKDKEIKNVLAFLSDLPLNGLVVKYNVDKYVKELHTLDVIKISVLFFFSNERYFKHFLQALMVNPICCRLFGVPVVSVQQVYKALQNRCWLFFYEAFHQVVKVVKGKESPEIELFRSKEIKILDSTFLKYALSRIFFAKFGYSSSDKKYRPGIKLHVLMNKSCNIPEEFIETAGNVHDSKVADTVLKGTKNCILLIDKGYLKLKRFKELDSRNVTFVIPLKQKLKFDIIEEKTMKYEGGTIETKIVELSNGLRVRYVKCIDFELICNDCSLQWYEIVGLYSFRWEVEILFKKLKGVWKINKPLFRNHNSIMAFICITMIAMIVLDKAAEEHGEKLGPTHRLMCRKVAACLIIDE